MQDDATADAAPLPCWSVYVLAARGARGTYVGVTTDLERRARQHNGELPGGARATRRSRPWHVARTFGPFATRGEAQRVEHALKRLRGSARLDWSGPAGEQAPLALERTPRAPDVARDATV